MSLLQVRGWFREHRILDPAADSKLQFHIERIKEVLYTCKVQLSIIMLISMSARRIKATPTSQRVTLISSSWTNKKTVHSPHPLGLDVLQGWWFDSDWQLDHNLHNYKSWSLLPNPCAKISFFSQVSMGFPVDFTFVFAHLWSRNPVMINQLEIGSFSMFFSEDSSQVSWWRRWLLNTLADMRSCWPHRTTSIFTELF